MVILFSYFLSTGTVSLAGGSLSWTRDLHVTNGQDFFDVWSAPAVSGLASSTQLTFTATSNFGGVLIGGVSISGVDMTAGGGVDVTGNTTTTGTAWSTGSATAVIGGIALGGSGAEAASTTETATATSPATLLHHLYNATDGQGFATSWLVVSAGGAGAMAGTFAHTSTASTGAVVIYAATGGTTPTPTFQPTRMPLGV